MAEREKEAKDVQQAAALKSIAPKAIVKPKVADGDAARLTKREIVAVAAEYYNDTTLKESSPKTAIADRLNKLVQNLPTVLEAVVVPASQPCKRSRVANRSLTSHSRVARSSRSEEESEGESEGESSEEGNDSEERSGDEDEVEESEGDSSSSSMNEDTQVQAAVPRAYDSSEDEPEPAPAQDSIYS